MENRGSAVSLVFWAALLAGFGYLFVVVTGMQGPAAIAWKGAGVALLALWCGLNARSGDGWRVTAVMALGALGDLLLETHGLVAGAVAFALGHVVAIWLYVRNRRPTLSASQSALAAVVAVSTPLIAWGLTGAIDAASYALLLGIMAGMAWTSRFPRFRTGIGAMMFVASDLLIFARMGVLAGAAWASIAIWLLYFGGQVMIALGVVKTLRGNA